MHEICDTVIITLCPVLTCDQANARDVVCQQLQQEEDPGPARR